MSPCVSNAPKNVYNTVEKKKKESKQFPRKSNSFPGFQTMKSINVDCEKDHWDFYMENICYDWS